MTLLLPGKNSSIQYPMVGKNIVDVVYAAVALLLWTPCADHVDTLSDFGTRIDSVNT